MITPVFTLTQNIKISLTQNIVAVQPAAEAGTPTAPKKTSDMRLTLYD